MHASMEKIKKILSYFACYLLLSGVLMYPENLDTNPPVAAFGKRY